MRKPNPLSKSLVVLACALAFVSSAAIAVDAVYKWKDANGQSHYSQSPPPSGTKYETITPIGAPASSSDSDSAAPASGSTSFKSPTQSDNTTARQTYRQKNCTTARANLALLNANPSAGAVSKSGSGPGGSSTPAAQPHAEAVAKASQQVDLYCGK